MQQRTVPIPTTSTSHPDDPIPHEPFQPKDIPDFQVNPATGDASLPANSPRSSEESAEWSGESSNSSNSSTPRTDPHDVDEVMDKVEELPRSSIKVTANPNPRKRRASTTLITENTRDIRRLLGEGEAGTQLIQKYCCGGGCCLLPTLPPDTTSLDYVPVVLPDNAAFRSIQLKLGPFSLDTELTSVVPLPASKITFESVPKSEPQHVTTVYAEPPRFVQPHPPHHVYAAPVFNARELTKPGADKRTYHFDIDVTDYPEENNGVDFTVGGAIGVCPPNDSAMVDDLFDSLGTPKFVRDKPVLLKTSGGRWPTIWGDEEARELVTTRRELLTWCVDIQSSPPTKPLLRLMAEHADATNEKKILMYLSSAEGQASFCDLRTGPHITVAQLLHAFPSSRPPLPALMSQLTQLMPRFYSLSNDPHLSDSSHDGTPGRRIIEVAVAVHETPDWHGDKRTGLGSGFLECVARKFMDAESEGLSAKTGGPAGPEVLDIKIPMFRGLMANPLSREFVSDGPMILIGAGVGIAPFRGFIHNRLKNANCANKVWLIQGIRDSELDEIYSGELGDHESEIKKVVQSRKKDRKEGDARYVQDEVRVQADVVWFVINALDGRIFICGSSKGMGEGVEGALVDVAMEKGKMNREEAKTFWETKRDGGQLVAETW